MMRAMAMEDAEHEATFGYGEGAKGASTNTNNNVSSHYSRAAPGGVSLSPRPAASTEDANFPPAVDDGVANAPGAAPIPAFPEPE